MPRAGEFLAPGMDRYCELILVQKVIPSGGKESVGLWTLDFGLWTLDFGLWHIFTPFGRHIHPLWEVACLRRQFRIDADNVNDSATIDLGNCSYEKTLDYPIARIANDGHAHC